MANKVGINITGLQADKEVFESRLEGCRSITQRLTNGVDAMERGLDKTRLQNVKPKIDSVLEVQHTLERYYEWAIRVIDECIEKYQSVDSVLEKRVDDMYDDQGNILDTQTVAFNAGEAYRNKITEVIEQEKNDLQNSIAQKYWSWYYGEYSDRSDGWCAVFASYMMEKAGIDVNSPTSESECFKTSPAYQFNYLDSKGLIEQKSSGDIPQVGDLVFYEAKDGSVGHVAVVSSVENGTITTLHGNVGFSTIYEMPENYYLNSDEGGYCKILGYGNIAALAALQAN